MTELFPVNSMRGITLPEGIAPDFMFQIGGDDCLIVQDVKGRLFARKGQRWYKMVEFKVKELVEEQIEVTHAPVDPTPEPTIPETAIRLTGEPTWDESPGTEKPPEGGSTPTTDSPLA